MKKNVAGQSIGVQMISSSDGTAFTSTVTVYVTGDAGSQALGATASGVCTHEGNGYHTYLPSQAETNYSVIAFTYIGTSAIPVTIQVETGFPQTVDNDTVLAGLNNLSAAQVNTEVDTAISDANLATSSQVSGIANVGSAINTIIEADNTSGPFTVPNTTFVGVIDANTYTSTVALDGIYHQIGDVTDAIDIVYRADVGGDGVPSSITWTGYVSAGNDTITVSAWSFTGTPGWIQVGSIDGQSGSTNIVVSFSIFTSMVGTTSGTDLGKVYLRFHCTGQSNPTLYTDQLYASHSSVSRTVGYANGMIWIDTDDGVAGTETYVNGVADNPVASLSDAVTIASGLNIHSFHATPDSSITLGAAFQNSTLVSTGATIAFNGKDCAGSHFTHCLVSGVILSGAAEVDFVKCEIGNVTVNSSHFDSCGFQGTLTLGSVNSTLAIIDGYSLRAGATAGLVLDFGTGSANHDVTLANYQNGIQIQNFNVVTTGGTDLLSLSGIGKITVDSTCDGGTINLRGIWEIVDNSGGAVTFAYDEIHDEIDALAASLATLQADLDIITDTDGVVLGAAGVDLIWDEVLTGTTHNVTNSAGRRLRESAGKSIHSGTAQTGSTVNTIKLATAASSTDGAYDPAMIAIVDGTGAGQTRLIYQYNGSTRVAAVDRNWKVTPDNTSEYVVYAHPGREHVNEGLAQAGASTTITLNALASGTDDDYRGQLVFIRSGTGEDQVRLVLDYDGTTKIATIDRAWDTNPDATSGYVVLPTQVITPAAIADAVLDEVLSGHTTAGTLGKAVADVETVVDNLSLGIIYGTAATGTLSTTVATSDLSGYTDDQLIGRVIVVTSGVAEGEATDITDYADTNGTLTFTALTLAMGNGDTFKIV